MHAKLSRKSSDMKILAVIVAYKEDEVRVF